MAMIHRKNEADGSPRPDLGSGCGEPHDGKDGKTDLYKVVGSSEHDVSVDELKLVCFCIGFVSFFSHDGRVSVVKDNPRFLFYVVHRVFFPLNDRDD
mmetsp:Transcript_11786/g.22774  ORF Transcript_11786/g.22774 Transcript_11786/m.22774 type:complete len:97 (+) Transcript_11786:97-387(+)